MAENKANQTDEQLIGTLDSDKPKVSDEQLRQIEETLPSLVALDDDAKAVEGLLGLEKIARVAQDKTQCIRIAIAIITRDFDRKNFVDLNEHLKILAKRRGQLKTVILMLTRKALAFTPFIQENKKRLELVRTLKELIDGKIFAERERAQVAKILAEIYEAEGDVAEAAKQLQEIQVETFGSMSTEEKLAFLLEQIRLCLATGDYVKALIFSNKVNRKLLNEKQYTELKTKFYTLMIKYYSHDYEYLELCRCFMNLYDVNRAGEFSVYLENYLIFAILTPFCQEQDDFVRRISVDPNLEKTEELKTFKAMVEDYLKTELISWTKFTSIYREPLMKLEFFSQEKAWSDLRDRIIEHNVRVVAQYYSSITITRLAQLLELSKDQTEEYVSKLVVSHEIIAKINRPQDIIVLGPRPTADGEFAEWTNGLSTLLSAVDDSNQHIHRQLVLHEKDSQ